MKRLIALAAASLTSFATFAEDTPPPTIEGFTVSNNVKSFRFTPSPAIQQYTIKSGTNLNFPLLDDNSGVISNFTFRTVNTSPSGFYRVAATPMSSNDLLAVSLLNRLAYGPTPDELVRVRAMGPQAYINEQLAPENITETQGSYISETTNGVPPSGNPEWRFLSFSGVFTSSNLYVYLTKMGAEYLDDISLRPILTVITTNITQSSTNYVTNIVEGAEAIVDGDFENPLCLTAGVGRWNETAMTINSSLSTAYAHSGTQSLHLVSSGAGSTEGNSIYQRLTNLTFNFNGGTQRGILRFWYLPSANSRDIKIRLSGSGIVGTANNAPPPAPEWFYATATGIAENNNRTIYIYLDGGAGEAFIDDIKLVPGTVPEIGPNLIRNGDFETPLGNTNWNTTANFSNSFISATFSHSGAGSLKVVGTADGSGSANALFQTNIFTTNAQTYTLSFWYTIPTRNRTLTVRLTGADAGDPGVQAYEPNSSLAHVQRKLADIGSASFEDGSETIHTFGGAMLADLRSYHVQNAISAKRQLIEVLLQFLENHFVTQHAKSVDYFDRFYDDGTIMDVLATEWEYRERARWQAALLNPNCNFYDLLKIHVESPAEIVYLDSVDSRGQGNNVANENYAREIMELFCMGVDNGYDQQDIVVMSRAWTGWSVEIVDRENIYNPFAPRSERVGFYPGNGTSQASNLIGVWTFNYKQGNHGTNRAPIWSVWDPTGPATNPRPMGSLSYPYTAGQSKVVPPRFGAPWAGQPYRLVIPPSRSGTNGIRDGYDITATIADLPFTMEYISVKLCRLFVHEGFPNPNTFVGSPEYQFYDYTNPNRSAEAELIRQCMVAWNTPVNGRKGNIRAVLNTIFNSDLFRSHGGSLQKVKTPIEFAASTIRALQTTNAGGALTATSDGYSISGRSRGASSAPLTRMGGMMLFDRDSPDGYPEAGSSWISSGTLAERIRFIQTTLMTTADTNKNDGISGGNFNRTDPVGLLKAKVPSGNWQNSGAVADFFLGILFPAEGAGNLQDYRSLAMTFLDTNDNGVGSSPFSSLTHTTPASDTRVRALVAMLMSLPRFQEQ